jgi:D-lactate dehydrogenase (cytochrome)
MSTTDFDNGTTSHSDDTLRMTNSMVHRNRLVSDYYTTLTNSHIAELKSLLSTRATLTQNPYELIRHGKGESYHPPAAPDLVVCPATLDDVRHIVRFCYGHRIPLIPFGAGTSLEGHVHALYGGISLDMCLFDSIELSPEIFASKKGQNAPAEIDMEFPDPIARVGAGVTRSKLNEALRHTGMRFTVDPGADATIGGQVATGASGTTTVRYGTMRENVLAIEAVLADSADATVVQTGCCSLKSSAGYDLRGLLIGSEGTLGVITSVTVKLHPVLDYRATAVATFATIADAAQAVIAIKFSGIPILRCELLDANSVEAFNDYQNKNLRVLPTLFLEFEAFSEGIIQEQIRATQNICESDFGAQDFRSSSDDETSAKLWAARHKLYYAALACRKSSTGAIVTDACVPMSQFANVFEETVADVKETGVVGPCFAHAGEGNLHCILPVCDEDEQSGYFEKLLAVQQRLTKRTIQAGGTISGEHGIGYGKMPYLKQMYGEGVPKMMKIVKRALDPRIILNPGKVVAMDSENL